MTSSTFATTIYCKMAQDWWKADGAAVGAYAWKGENASGGKNAEWPGVRMTATGEADVWSVDIDLTKYEKIIFTRVNGSGDVADWGAKTKDLALPTDGKNLFTITTSTAVWGDPGCEGEWSVYGEGGGDQPGGGEEPGGGELEESGEGHEFSLMGSIGGNWNIEVPMAEYTFDARGRWTGVLGSHPDKEHISYVVIIDEEGNQYKTKGWQGENATKVTLYWANGFEDSNVWQLPADQTLYLIMRKCTFKGSIEVEIVDQATYEAYSIDWGTSTPGNQNEAVANTVVKTKARKAIIDGRLVIIRGEQMFDATGRAL